MMAAESPANMLLLDTKECCMLRKVIAFTEVRTTLVFLLNAIKNLDEHKECKSLVVFRERVEKFSEWINLFLTAGDAPPDLPPECLLTEWQLDEIAKFARALAKCDNWIKCLSAHSRLDAASDFCFTLTARIPWTDAGHVAVVFQQALGQMEKP